jgi:predicted flap endonuclease-1-like 5' DNA nuclease
MWFIIGVLIGGVIVYFFLQDKMKETQKTEQKLRRQLADSESEARNLSSQLANAEPRDDQSAASQAELQTKTQELQQVTDQLSAAEAQIKALREELAAAGTRVEASTESAVPEETEDTPPSSSPDDLKKIEGIGPKVSQLLNESGILTFAQLAQTDVSKLREILQEAGPRFKMMEPESWPEQAGLAAKGDWDGLAKLQDELDGGKYRH